MADSKDNKRLDELRAKIIDAINTARERDEVKKFIAKDGGKKAAEALRLLMRKKTNSKS